MYVFVRGCVYSLNLGGILAYFLGRGGGNVGGVENNESGLGAERWRII